jgi:hypothetical protein
MESDKGASWQEVRRWHREWLAEELPELGPVKFIEALRVMKQAHDENVSINQVPEMLRDRKIEFDHERLTHLMVGYQADKAEWNEILGLLEREVSRLRHNLEILRLIASE